LLVAHHAIPEGAEGIARKLHMPPSEIGRVAAEAKVGTLILSHRMKRTLGLEARSLELIRRSYRGPVTFAEDMACF
jgi:ribonuclease BN (tRNA processing enzyme)